MGFTDLFKKIFGTKAERDLKQLRPMLDKVLAAYETIDKLDNDQLSYDDEWKRPTPSSTLRANCSP